MKQISRIYNYLYTFMYYSLHYDVEQVDSIRKLYVAV